MLNRTYALITRNAQHRSRVGCYFDRAGAIVITFKRIPASVRSAAIQPVERRTSLFHADDRGILRVIELRARVVS